MPRVEINPALLSWACERSGRSPEELAKRFPRLEQWLEGERMPTFRQLEEFARATHTAIGYFFLSQPPEEELPIPDMRTIAGQETIQPSPDLLDTLYLCQRRQAWYRDYALSTGHETLQFVGSLTCETPPEVAAERIRQALDLDSSDLRSQFRDWADALRHIIARIEDAGVLVMVSGVVGNNNKRRLSPQEFRGFALADDLAPLIFVNGKDVKAAQMFTLAHETAHLWLGETALSNAGVASRPAHKIEKWCNAVAAEMLVPLRELQDVLSGEDPLAELDSLVRRFKVSRLVVIRRLLDAGSISREEFQQAYSRELYRVESLPRSRGGDFYLTQEVRVSRRFVRALVANTLEGRTLYRDAFQLLGIKREQTFLRMGQRAGVTG